MALFVTFEGLDGSGKSTHLARVSRWLEAERVPHVVTHEPGGTPISEAIRAVFLDRGHRAMDPRVELLLVFASRRQHLVEVIEPALAAGRHVLCDRFTDSTVAYQGYGRGVALDVVAEVDRLATGGRRPDRTLYFDLTAELARHGQLVVAEKLSAAERRLGVVASGERPVVAAEPTGFFLIRAGSLDEALAIARRCPHLAHGGEVALRPIDPT